MKPHLLARLAVLFALTTTAQAVDTLAVGSNNFADAPAINSPNGRSSATNLTTYTREGGEANHHPNGDTAGVNSAWWSWTAPESGFCTVSTRTTVGTANAVADTVMGVYTGTAVNNLTVVGRNDDYSQPGFGADRLYSSLVFYALAGSTYKIAVAAYSAGDVTATAFNVNMDLRLVPIRKMVRTSTFYGYGLNEQLLDLYSVTLTTTGTGRFSAKLTTLAKTYAFSGAFGVDGLFTISFDRPGAKGAAPKTPITLLLDIAGTGQAMVLQDNARSSGEFPERAVFSNAAPSAAAGQFTAILPTDGNPNAGSGTLAFSVSKLGVIKGAGSAHDGTPFTFSSALHKADSPTVFIVPMLSVMHAKKGGMLLNMYITEQGAKDSLYMYGFYSRPAVAGAAFYAMGYLEDFQGYGGTYVPPAAGSRALGFLDPDGAGMMQVVDGGGELPNGSFDENLTLSTANKFIFASATRKPSLKLNVKTGIVTGSVSEPATKKRAIKGVLTEYLGATYLQGNVSGTGRALYFRVIP